MTIVQTKIEQGTTELVVFKKDKNAGLLRSSVVHYTEKRGCAIMIDTTEDVKEIIINGRLITL